LQDIHIGTCRLGLVISMIVRSRSSVNTATGDSSPNRVCRPIASAMLRSGLHTLQKCGVMQRVSGCLSPACLSTFLAREALPAKITMKICPQAAEAGLHVTENQK